VPNPPVPIEIKRKRGTLRRDRQLHQGNLVMLPMAQDVPAVPPELRAAGRALWALVWEHGMTWISPVSDMAAVGLACQLADGVVKANERYMVTGEPRDARAWVAISVAFSRALSALGFDPTARARLGVAEVKAASAIDKLLDRKAQRDAALGSRARKFPPE